jgi:hypothetical protein
LLIPALVVVTALGASCSSAGGTGGQRIPGEVAEGLAARADRVAAALDAGACPAALGEAQALHGEIAALDAESAVKAEALAGAARLVSGISCPPPTTGPAVVNPNPAGGAAPGKRSKGHKGDDDKD